MRHHAIAASKRVLRRAPYVVLGGGLHVPHVARVSGQLSASERLRDGVLVAYRAARRVHEPRAALEVLEELGVHEAPRALVQRTVDRDDVALRDQLAKVVDPARSDGFLRF